MVNKEDFSKAIEQLRKDSKKRKFSQALELIVNFKHVDLKKNPVDSFVVLPHAFTKQTKVCAIVDDDYINQTKGSCDRVISKTELDKWTNNKNIKKLGKEFGFFISQANLMGLVATKFGRILGPMGKMPNPKFGGVVPPGGDLKPAVTKFRKSIRIMNKNEPILKTRIGYEDMKDEDLTVNAFHIYDNLVHALPHGEINIHSVLVKFTMSKPIEVGENKSKKNEKEETPKKSPKKIKKEDSAEEDNKNE